MMTLPRRLLWVLTAIIVQAAAGDIMAQSPAALPSPSWQPYRDAVEPVSMASAAGLGSQASPESVTPIQLAQFPAGAPGVCPPLCPEPTFAAPVCPGTSYVPALAYVDPSGAPPTSPEFWQWRVLPDGVIWQSYWAGVHEPRLAFMPFQNDNGVNLADVSLGGRGSLLRYGTDGPGRPQGLELQVEGAAFPRLNLDEHWDLEAVDFRGGFPLVYGREKWQTKFAYYHLSSHMGDEFAIREDALGQRINYSRDSLVLAFSYFPLPAWRWYAEAAWAFRYDVTSPWEFQFGVDVAEPGPTGPWGTPFIALNGHIHQDVDYGGNVVAQLGWLWRGNTTHTLRAGFHYFNGKSNQFEFYQNFEQQVGGGLWYDF
jgi:hypothetical protein